MQKRETVQKKLLSNIDRLVASADLLAEARKFGPAVHLVMAAREECVKWIVLYSWDHLDERTQKKLYNHIFKHELGGIFHYLSGRVQASEIFSLAIEHLKGRDSEWDRAASTLSAFLQETTENLSPEDFANRITEFLYEIDRSEYEAQYKAALAQNEVDRTSSIYVDFDKSFEVRTDPAKMRAGKFKEYRRDVDLARCYINRLLGRPLDKEVLRRILPGWRRNQFLGDLKRRLRGTQPKTAG